MAKTLSVYVNPYRVTDSEQRPCCIVNIDPHDPRYPRDVRGWRGLVGAKLSSATRVREGDEDSGGLRAHRYEREWAFERGPIQLPNTDYYRRVVADGDLLPADESTAKLCRATLRDIDEVRLETQVANEALDAVWLENNGD